MAPKVKAKETDENYWRRRIEEIQLDEDTWKVKVILLESAGSDQDRIYLSRFESFACEERRFVVKNICKTETIFMINQLGADKKIKDDSLRVFEEGQAYLKERKDIPADILALIIKHLIIKMKEEYIFIRRQKLEVKEGLRRESATMIDKAEVRGTVGAKPPESVADAASTPAKSAAKKGKGKGEPELTIPEPEEGKKYNTVLRERGEEWRDRVYVDDFPLDGPSLYVAVTGFLEPLLPNFLVRIGIPLTAIVQIRIDPTMIKVPSTLSRPTKRGQSQSELITEKSIYFWESLQELRIQKETADDFKNTVFVIFSPPYWETEALSGSPDKIYDEVCYLMYDIQDLSRQHINYLDNMHIIHIPEDEIDPRYASKYHEQIDDMPFECVTIYSLLDSILHVSSKVDVDEQSSTSTSLTTAVTLNQRSSNLRDTNEKVTIAKTLMRNVFNTLCKTDAEKKTYRVTYGEEYENYKDPIVIKYGNFAMYPTFHIGNINLENIVNSTLFKMPIHNLWQAQAAPVDEAELKINFHVNMLLSCFDRTDVETAELNRLLHILSFRKLYSNRSSLKQHHLQSQTINSFKKLYLKRSMLAEPLPRCQSLHGSMCTASPSFPSMTKSENLSNLMHTEAETDPESYRIKYLFDCPDISELVSAAEIANEQPVSHMIDDFEYFEDFSGICAYQILLDAFNKYNCLDYKYCEVTDCILLMFFNSHDKYGISRGEWRCHLPTPLCLQDFFDFVLEEHFDWIQNEEIIYEQNNIRRQSECQEVIEVAPISCIEETNVELDLLLEGSLKHQKYIQSEESAQDLSEKLEVTPGKKRMSSPSSDVMSKSSKKSKSSEPSPRKRQSYSAVAIPEPEEPEKPFSGYDLGDRRVEVFGKDATFFSKDGTCISTNYTLLIPMNIEFIVLNLTPGNCNNEIWVHKALGESLTPEIFRICESFRINSKDNLMMNVTKQYYEEHIPNDAAANVSAKQKEPATKLSEASPETILFETKEFYALSITWPNGLITESVHAENSSQISHIKQFFIEPRYGEDMRCISLNGEVIIFLSSGEIEVLRPDGTYILITKCGKVVVVPEVLDELVSETSSADKKKAKGKGKEKLPGKPSKASAKEEEVIEEKPPEYELVIEEYEIIETSGLRQKWVENESFDIEKLVIRTATEYCLGEIFSRRQDGTHILLNRDGVQIVTFPNNTRIISEYVVEMDEIYPEWTEEEIEYFELFDSTTLEDGIEKSKASGYEESQKSHHSGSFSSNLSNKVQEEEEKERNDGYISIQLIYTIEHQNFTTVTINKTSERITIDSPNNTSVTIDRDNNYVFVLDSVTNANFNGDILHVNYEACPKCRSYTTCDLKIENAMYVGKEITADEEPAPPEYWVKLKDSFCRKIVVDNEGAIDVLNEPCSQEALGTATAEDMAGTDAGLGQNQTEDASANRDDTSRADGKSETSVTSHGRCGETYQSKNVRFMVLKRDLTCSELIHRTVLEQYQQACRWQPWCNINNYETFGDNRVLRSILTPVHITETEKWIMESKMTDKPKRLTYKDLKPDTGKGFYHWMRPYERFEPKPLKPDTVLVHNIPRAFILRTLELQWREKDREALKGGKELLMAVLRYRRMIEAESETMLHVPLVDLRLEDERKMDEIVQALAHRLYNNLKRQLEEDVETRAKATITTEPAPPAEEMYVEGEMGEEEEVGVRLAEERKTLVKDLEEASKMSPNLQRYWRRRAEEKKEEEFYLYLLREGTVPQYFRNILGGAIWWDMNHAAGDAVSKAERRRMKCVCEEEASTSRTATTQLPFP